jgi:hypothetical protein
MNNKLLKMLLVTTSLSTTLLGSTSDSFAGNSSNKQKEINKQNEVGNKDLITPPIQDNYSELNTQDQGIKKFWEQVKSLVDKDKEAFEAYINDKKNTNEVDNLLKPLHDQVLEQGVIKNLSEIINGFITKGREALIKQNLSNENSLDQIIITSENYQKTQNMATVYSYLNKLYDKVQLDHKQLNNKTVENKQIIEKKYEQNNVMQQKKKAKELKKKKWEEKSLEIKLEQQRLRELAEQKK